MSLSNYDPGQELSSIDFSALIGGPLNAIVDAQSKAALSTVDFVKSVGFTPDTEDETTGEITPGEPIYVNFKYPKMVKPYQPAIIGKLDEITIDAGGTGYVIGDVLGVNGISVTVTNITGAGVVDTISYSTSGTNGLSNETSQASTGGSGTGATFNITVEDIPSESAEFEEMRFQAPILSMMPIPFIRVEEGEIDFHAKITSMEYKRVGSDFKAGVSSSFDNKNTNKNYAFWGGLNYNENVNTVKLNTSLSYQRSAKSGHKIEKTYHMGVKVKVAQEEMPEGMEKLLGILDNAMVSQPVE